MLYEYTTDMGELTKLYESSCSMSTTFTWYPVQVVKHNILPIILPLVLEYVSEFELHLGSRINGHFAQSRESANEQRIQNLKYEKIRNSQNIIVLSKES